MLIIDPHARERFLEIIKFATEHDLLSQIVDTLNYLNHYANGEGCMYDKTKGKNTCCTLLMDWAPLSMRIRMDCTDDWDGTAGRWTPLYTGGLIYQGPDLPADGSEGSLTVSLDRTKIGWSIHT